MAARAQRSSAIICRGRREDLVAEPCAGHHDDDRNCFASQPARERWTCADRRLRGGCSAGGSLSLPCEAPSQTLSRSSGSVLHGPWGSDDVIRFGHDVCLLPCLRLRHVGQQLLERLGPRGPNIGRSRSEVVSPHTCDDNYENETKRFTSVSPQSSARIAANSGVGCCGIVHREK